MNRVVEEFYKRLSWKSYGFFVIRAYEFAPEAYKRNKKYHSQNNKIANPIELVKYSIKIYDWLPPGGEEKVSLKALQQINDPYEVITFDKFCGRFEYDYDEEGFLPVYVEAEGTKVMKQIWDKIESKRVHRAWSQAKKYVSDPKGNEPILIYKEG